MTKKTKDHDNWWKCPYCGKEVGKKKDD